MREDIGLFRGKRLDNGEWVEGYLSQHTMVDCNGARLAYVIEPVPKKLWVVESFEVDPATVGEYCGQKDKNGKRIFEGDMLRIEWHAPCRETVYEYHEVVYSKGGFFTKYKGSLRGQVGNYVSPNVNFRCEAVGTVFDNPELLEV